MYSDPWGLVVFWGMVPGRSCSGLLRTGLGPVGCRPSGCCGAVGMRMHSSNIAAFKARLIGRAAC